MSGAQFELKDAAGNKINFTGTDGTYTKDAQGTAVLTTGTNGKLTIKGLAPGQYKLKETKAPSNYVLSSNEIAITIKDYKDEDINGILDSKESQSTTEGDTQVPSTDNGLLSITVENTKGFTLPRTGGIGTVLFTMVGIVLMGGGVLLIAVFLRKRFGKAK
ncbi:MAG: LPXTG cell wall anchor domain-containing protein [Oscillospiraceae bacterium]|nr:LPXTG cell wall anchor domain-containing protein [Oscillospiraceae bacterium]